MSGWPWARVRWLRRIAGVIFILAMTVLAGFFASRHVESLGEAIDIYLPTMIAVCLWAWSCAWMMTVWSEDEPMGRKLARLQREQDARRETGEGQ